MHSSRMRTDRCCGCHEEVSIRGASRGESASRGGSAFREWGMPPEGGLLQGDYYPLPVNRQTPLKTLPSLAVGNKYLEANIVLSDYIT